MNNSTDVPLLTAEMADQIANHLRGRSAIWGFDVAALQSIANGSVITKSAAAEEADRARIVELTETLNVIAVERGELKDVLSRNGFVRCDNPVCNCNSWHARYGLYERFQEIKQLLRDADVLNNDTGNLPSKAIELLIQQRDEARQALSGGSENG